MGLSEVGSGTKFEIQRPEASSLVWGTQLPHKVDFDSPPPNALGGKSSLK